MRWVRDMETEPKKSSTNRRRGAAPGRSDHRPMVDVDSDVPREKQTVVILQHDHVGLDQEKQARQPRTAAARRNGERSSRNNALILASRIHGNARSMRGLTGCDVCSTYVCLMQVSNSIQERVRGKDDDMNNRWLALCTNSIDRSPFVGSLASN
jgi:hypothetical protein